MLLPRLSVTATTLGLLLLSKSAQVWAAECTEEQKLDTDSYLLALASMDACAPYSVTAYDGHTASIFLPCGSYGLSCAAYVQIVADEVPDCDYVDAYGSTNNKQELLSKLTTCGFCTTAQENEVHEWYQAAASNPACSDSDPDPDTVLIEWYCNTPCQAVMEDLASKVHDCTLMSGSNEKTDLEDSTGSCTSSTLTPRTTYAPTTTTTYPPFSISSSGGSSYTEETPAPEESTPSPWMTTSSGSSWLWGDEGETITEPTYSSTSCSYANVTAMAQAAYAVAVGPECSSVSTTSPYQIYISDSCGTSCATALAGLATELPDCYYDMAFENMKEYLSESVAICTSNRERRRLKAQDASWHTVTFTMDLDGTISFADVDGSNSAARAWSSTVVAFVALAGVLALA